ncbi:DEAD/DEAH box helicase family protein [Planctomycetota bacterium]
MQSLNFEHLRPRNEELARLGAFAERYAHSDPASALVNLRKFGENLVADFFFEKKIRRYPQSTFIEMLDLMREQNYVPPVVLDKLHLLRKTGNQAAHGQASKIVPRTALLALHAAFDLGKWFNISVYADNSVNDQNFKEPTGSDSKGTIQREKKAALQKLAAQEAQMEKLLKELEATRSKAAAAEKSKEEIQEILSQTNQAASVLQFDEATTRKLLIDQLLVQAGWNVGADGVETDQVKQEFAVNHQPNQTGKGSVDYVLWDTESDIPVALVEAKKTAYDPEKGKKQAVDYASALEKDYGQRPVIFCTNGHDIIIHDDAKGHVGRRIYGFYSLQSIRYCLWQTENRQDITVENPKKEIVPGRIYQTEAIKKVCEKFSSGRRRALIVQATGTGKTRVAIALTELLIRCKWAKRVLFLCDRRELRKQAYNAYGEHIKSEPRIYVTARTAHDRNKTIYLATYPAMMKYFQSFDVGFFDLIIADESHRSIYNRYHDLFLYFDAYQVGLTATPRQVITHNTYSLFDCEDEDPTAYFSYKDAIEHVPPYLTHFKAVKHTTKFMRKGIKYSEMSPEEQAQLENQIEDPERVDFSKEAIDQSVFNKDTDRRIVRNLMDNGIRDASAQRIGKTIVFARNHNHAMQLMRLFEEMYPQYMKPKQEFCAVIDNYIDRAEQLIDDFKGDGTNNNLTIAISVDMMDTGIDVPEVVNLVFAKPVKSYVKFWQMIGRGTRLCKNLFGPGKDKEQFLIFDHWGNFEYFDENPEEAIPSVKKSLMQRIFETRMDITELAIKHQTPSAFDCMTELLLADVRSLPEDTIAIKEKWRLVKTIQQDGVIQKFDAATIGTLRMEIAGLMQWRTITGYEDAYRFDLLIAQLQRTRLSGSSEFSDFKDSLLNQVGELPINIAQVNAKIAWIDKVKSGGFWTEPGVMDLEEIRTQLRGIMQYRNKTTFERIPPLSIDVTDSGEKTEEIKPRFEGLDLAAYRHRVESVLNAIFDETPVLQKIKQGQPVSETEIAELSEKVILRDPQVSLDDLLEYFPNKAKRLDLAIRQIIGLDAEAVDSHFSAFVQANPSLNSHQIRFLEMIKKHIATYGKLEIEQLYDSPFTAIHNDGIDGIFPVEEQVDALMDLIEKANELALSA